MSPAKSDELSLFVMIDALGWELVKTHGFLDDLLPRRSPLGTIFGYSSTCCPTFLTGKLPREHGHFTFYKYDPEGSPFGMLEWLRYLPHFATRRGRVRRLMSKAVEWAYGYTGYFQLYNMPFEYLPLFDYSEKKDLYSPGGINGGQETAFDAMDAAGLPYFQSDWRAPEAARLAALGEAVDAGQVRFAYLYLGGLDGVLHAKGTGAEDTVTRMRAYEAALRAVIERAEGRYRKVRVHLFSDHGMTDTVDTCNLLPRIEALGLRFGVDYAACYDSTMARFWFHHDAARERVEEVLRSEPRGRILDDGTLEAWGCDFPGRAYGELFFLMDPGVLLVPSFMGEAPLPGMHGYSPEDRHSLALYATNAEDVAAPARLDGVYQQMLAEVGLRPRCEAH